MAKIEKINEKAKSKSQQRLFGMVTAYKDGKLKLKDLPDSLAKKIKSIADGERKKTGDKRKKTKGISKSNAKDFAKTKHKGLPEKVSESKIMNFENFINESKDDKDSYGSVVVGDKPENYMDALKGGEAEEMTLEDIAILHEIPIEYLESILNQAIEIELEHTDDREVAKRIALDHLTETPLYYDDKIGLPNMEEELETMDDEEVEEIIDDRLNKNIKKFDDFEENE